MKCIKCGRPKMGSLTQECYLCRKEDDWDVCLDAALIYIEEMDPDDAKGVLAVYIANHMQKDEQVRHAITERDTPNGSLQQN